MYTFDSRIRFGESDRNQRLTITGLLDYYQDVCTLQGLDLGLGWSDLQEMGYWWVTNFWQIEVMRYPHTGEYVTVGTQASDFKAFLGDRNFNMVTRDGEVLSVANSVWTLLSTKDGKPVRVPAEMVERYGKLGKLDMEYAPRKIKIPVAGQPAESIEVKKQHLDYNMHVNNAQYIRLALENIPEEFEIGTLLAEYKSQAHLGDVIYPVISKQTEEDGRTAYYISMNDAADKPYCIICVKGNKKML